MSFWGQRTKRFRAYGLEKLISRCAAMVHATGLERTTIGSEFRLRIKWHGLIRDKNVPFTQLADVSYEHIYILLKITVLASIINAKII